MIIEIAAGWWYNSMALLADGWHMSSHAVAIGLSALAYARPGAMPRPSLRLRHLENRSARRLRQRHLPHRCGADDGGRFGRAHLLAAADPFSEAIVVAVLGLVVNIVCALILNGAHDHGHSCTITAHGQHHAHPPAHQHAGDHDHGAHHAHGDHDLNLRAAYLHVIADAATSLLAIVALLGGMLYGWDWLDPLMGIVGAVLVSRWALGLDPRYQPCAA
jgi:Co/Zn/Cd efflux system component